MGEIFELTPGKHLGVYVLVGGRTAKDTPGIGGNEHHDVARSSVQGRFGIARAFVRGRRNGFPTDPIEDGLDVV